MKLMYKKLTFLLVFVLLATMAIAQEIVEPTPGEYLIDWTEALFGALIIIGGYVGNFIPGIKSINKAVYRVAAFALVAGSLFVIFTPMDAVSAIITYAISTSIYETILSLFKKSPKTEGEIKTEMRSLNR